MKYGFCVLYLVVRRIIEFEKTVTNVTAAIYLGRALFIIIPMKVTKKEIQPWWLRG